VRKISDAIPTTFTRLDESVVAADRFVDVRTQQLMRTNHNALLGGGHMRPIFYDDMACNITGSAQGYLEMVNDGWTGFSADPRMMTTFYCCDVYVSQMCTKVKVRIKAATSRNTISLRVSGALMTAVEGNRTLGQVTVSSSTASWQTFDIVVPPLRRKGFDRNRFTFRMWATPYALGSDLLSPGLALVASTPTSVSVSGAGLTGTGVQKGDILYFNGGPPPRPIHFVDLFAANDTLYASEKMPWTGIQPTAGTHTLYVKECACLELWGVQLLEYCRTGYFSSNEVEI